ncbi:MAG: hypothetical protein Q9208_004402 [Pyrenodesmia sp. 3 TL-2023]
MSSPAPQRFFNYPKPREAPETPPYGSPPANNPVVRGFPLSILGSLSTRLSIITSFLYTSTKFPVLRTLKDLDDYEPRYDPTVIKLPSSSHDSDSSREGNEGYKSASEITDIRDQQSLIPTRYHSSAFYTRQYQSQQLTPTKVIEGLLAQISAKKEHSTAFLQIIPEKVVAAAEASTTRWRNGKPLSPLDGVPVAIKDELDLDGYEKSLGSPLDFTRKDGGTSWCIRRWEDAGAIVVGKLNMHELGLDTTNNNPTHGTPVNPHNPNYYTGGSSGGSAYAVSAGLIPIAHGADGGGSIRIPASYCGLYGLKPTHGRISISPTLALASSNVVHGPIASNMTDLELAYRLMATPDPSNPTSSLFAPPSPSPSPSPNRRNRILAICRPWFSSASAPVLAACSSALSHYTSSLNYTTIDISLPHLHAGQLAHALTILAEISAGLPRPPPATLSASNKLLLGVGACVPGTDLLLAQRLRSMLMQHLASLFQQHPGMLIVTPTTPNAGWRLEPGDLKYGVSDSNMSVESMRYVWLANFTGCPAITVPVGMVQVRQGEDKVPVGLMAMSEWGDEEGLIEWGKEAEEWAWREGEERVRRGKGWEDARAWMEER